jgi:chemotaxis-related protein WspD
MNNEECWNEIGVFGDSTCAELKEFHHCTHCPKYSEGARQLLDQEPPVDYLSEWTAVLAREKETPRKNTYSAVLFRIADHLVALSTNVFREVVDIRRVHTIPHRSNDLLLGLVNIRGTLHLCVNLTTLFQLAGSQAPAASAPANANGMNRAYRRMVVVEKDGNPWAFAVDEVLSMHRFSPEDIVPLPDPEKTSKGIVEWEGKTFDVLDENLFFKKLEQSLE